MSCVTYTEIAADSLYKKAVAAGFIHEAEICSHRNNSPVRTEMCIDFAKCCPEEWEKDRESIIRRGNYHYDSQSKTWVRSDLTFEEIESLHLYPVGSIDGGKDAVSLWINYDGGKSCDVAFYLSKAFPETEISIVSCVECIPDYEGTILNGIYKDKTPKEKEA